MARRTSDIPDATAPTPSLTAVPSPSTTEDLRLALRAATLYYLDGLTQAEVATRLGVSRPTAGRLVARAKAQGLVRIDVQVPAHLSDALRSDEERALEERFNLVEAVVVADSVDAAGPIDQHGSFAGVGRAAASLLVRRIRDTDTLGFTWGPETVAVAQGLPSGAAVCATVVQLDGSVSAINYQTGTEYVLGRCAEQLQANTIRLPVPLYADASTVVSMRGDSVISKALEVGRTAQMMMFGTGAVSTSTTLFEEASSTPTCSPYLPTSARSARWVAVSSGSTALTWMGR